MRKIENKMIVIEISGHSENEFYEEKYDADVCQFGVISTPVRATTPTNSFAQQITKTMMNTNLVNCFKFND